MEDVCFWVVLLAFLIFLLSLLTAINNRVGLGGPEDDTGSVVGESIANTVGIVFEMGFQLLLGGL